MRIAIIGTGIAGNAAAWLLGREHRVTVYEKEPRPGGHAHTVDINYDGTTIAVDTGFIVYNTANYPNFTALLEHLEVETVESDMSFAVTSGRGDFEWSGQQGSLPHVLNAVFAQRSNVMSPRFWRMLRDMTRFNAKAIADRAAGRLNGLSLGDYLTREGFSGPIVEDYLVPMAAAIWSTPVDQIMRFPAENFVAFFDNHRLIHWNRPRWRTVKGGSRSYVERMVAANSDRIRYSTAVTAIHRRSNGVEVVDAQGTHETYDQVIIATHSDEALALLADPSSAETAVLGAIRYRPNDVYLHRDTRLMPKRRRAWSAWNFIRDGSRGGAGQEVAISYWMNALQGIDASKPLFVTLNPPTPPAPALTFRRFSYSHPQYDLAAFAAQRQLDTIQGARRTWFCGAWAGYGFHEDGLKSAIAVARQLGVAPPWETDQAGIVSEAAE